VATLAAALALAGCYGGDKMADLRAYAEDVKARPAKPIDPLPEIRPYETYAYAGSDLRDPFEPPPGAEEVSVAAAEDNGIRPNANRTREPLEAFPLDTLRMVGILERERQLWAIVKASDGAIYRVQEGNYLGQNHGKITRITEQEVDLTEIVPDGLGSWLERPASIALNEQSRGG
jgi:type IV pilus assembly protein PilP